MVLFKLDVYPQIGSDEWWLLGRSHVLLREYSYTDSIAMDAVARGIERAPVPPMNLPLRHAIHLLFGTDVESDRFVSALQFIAVGAAFAAVAWRLGAPPDVALLGLPAYLLAPSVFFVARTYRYEQDVVFLGSVAVLVGFLLRRPTRFWLLIAAVSGTAAGMASVMHPFGLGFSAAIAAATAIAWLLGDRRHPRRQAAAVWLACAAVPVAITVAYYLADPSLNLGIETFVRPRESEQLRHRMAFLRSLYPPPLPGLPDRVLETMNALRWGLMPQPPAVVPQVTALTFTIVGLAAVALVYVGLAASLVRRLRRWRREGRLDARSFVMLTLWLMAVGHLVITAARPHVDYTVYVHGSVILAIFMWLAVGGEPPGNRWRHAGSRWSAMLVVVLLEVGYLGPVLAGRTEPAGVSLAAQTRSMAAVSRALGIDPDQTGDTAIYADLTSWAASGVRHAALFDYLILERVEPRPAVGGVIFDAEWLNGMVATIAPSSGETLDPERRRQRMAALLEGLELGAVMRIDPNSPRNPNVRLWYVRDAPPAPLFGIVGADGHPTVHGGQPVADRQEAAAAGAQRNSLRVRLEPGDYFALVSGTRRTATRVQASYGREEINGRPLDNFPQEYGGARLWLTLDRSTNIRFFLDSDGPEAGEVRLRVWRVGDAPATR